MLHADLSGGLQRPAERGTSGAAAVSEQYSGQLQHGRRHGCGILSFMHPVRLQHCTPVSMEQ